jgi:membrane protein
MSRATGQIKRVSARSLRHLAGETVSAWFAINAPRLGAALSYYTVLSIAPLLVLCIGLAGLVFGKEAAQGQIAYQIQNVVGPQGGAIIQGLVRSAAQPSTGIAATAVGLVMLLFGASAVFGELRDSLNLVWNVQSTTGGGLMGMLKYRFFSFALVLGIGFLLLVSLLLSAGLAAAGKFFESYLPLNAAVLHAINLVLSFAAITVLFALLYKVVPDVRIEWEDVWIGAAVTSLLFSFGKYLIGLYLGQASVGSAYGAAGSLVVFLVWVYYSAQIFFLGAEFTRLFSERHGSRARARAGGAPAAAVRTSALQGWPEHG